MIAMRIDAKGAARTSIARFDCFEYARTHRERTTEMTPNLTPRNLPTVHDIALARQSSRDLAAAILRQGKDEEQIDFVDPAGYVVRLPNSVLQLVADFLEEIAQGNALAFIPIHSELTTQEAADLLNVSRPFVVQQLEKGHIPFHKAGTHRRIRYQDLIAYKDRIDADRRKALDELAAQAQDLNMGY